MCRKCDESSVLRQQAVSVLTPLTLDACTEYLHDISLRTLEKTIGETDTEVQCEKHVLKHIYTLITHYTDPSVACR